MLCLVSLTLCTLKILIPKDKAKLIDDIVPPILSLVSYFPGNLIVNLFLDVPINIGKPSE